MKLKDLIRIVHCNTLIELFSRDCMLLSVFKRIDHTTNIDTSEFEKYLENEIFMVSADGDCLQIVIFV